MFFWLFALNKNMLYYNVAYCRSVTLTYSLVRFLTLMCHIFKFVNKLATMSVVPHSFHNSSDYFRSRKFYLWKTVQLFKVLSFLWIMPFLSAKKHLIVYKQLQILPHRNSRKLFKQAWSKTIRSFKFSLEKKKTLQNSK